MLARFAKHTSVAVIGIDVNDPASSALAFVHKTGVTYPVGTETAMGSTVIAYDLPGLPATFFLDSHHRIVKRVYAYGVGREVTADEKPLLKNYETVLDKQGYRFDELLRLVILDKSFFSVSPPKTQF